MILLSSIVKAKYVFMENTDDSNNIGNYVKIESDNNIKKDKDKVSVKTECSRLTDTKDDLYEIYNQREYIINDAKEEAAKIISTAKRNAVAEVADSKKKAFEEGYNSGLEIGKSKGYEEGYKEGISKAEEELSRVFESRMKEINDILKTIEDEKQKIISKYENEIETLSIDIAEKIMRQKIDAKENSISRIIESVIKDFKNVEWIKIYISDKENIEAIQADKLLIEELQKVTNDVKIEVLKDLNEGSCVVETPDNIIDAGIDTQLSNLKEILLNK